jgi:hypothetical protein
MTDLMAEERQRRLNEHGVIIVKKTGVGRDRYPWDEVSVKLDHGVLLIFEGDEDNGTILHAYSAGAWLEVELGEPE